ncbi:hypothetical protein H8A95_15835 [Bradyrhizobium sp. Pear76]|uniref:hypothetical protein n=1 Tax=Bradyrhizobium oropedii TaxID=1571201 RepID=UPI001E637894|nr:hypothetical protein [Bradyrhizobium oropedii]MCC8963741.1 hypothetical protein [Bradyrhizobium oropedii]
MTNALAPVDDLAARRTAAARKAWKTRRAQGWTPGGNFPQKSESSRAAAEEALAAFEREAASDRPDWHGAALKLKRALMPAPRTLTQKVTSALPAPVWHDYPVDKTSSFAIRTDSLVVTFADGEVVRAPAVSIKTRPTNIGRGLRVAIAFYQARMCWRRGIRFRPGVHAAVPAIALCICEDCGETFDPGICTVRTEEDRKAQDWKIKR